jgi:quinol-cytochrome oxidoreductase complex cytochrome b subunit
MAWERIAIFLFGVLFVIVVIVLAIWITKPHAFQSIVFRVVLALVAAAFFLAALGALLEAS